jgi:hypothetical protein
MVQLVLNCGWQEVILGAVNKALEGNLVHLFEGGVLWTKQLLD